MFKDATGKHSVRVVIVPYGVAVWGMTVVCVLVLQAHDLNARQPEEDTHRPQYAPPNVSYV